MIKKRYTFLIIVCLSFSTGHVFMPRSHALELSGYAAVEGRLFTDDPLYPEQERHVISLAIEPELYHKWEGGPSFIFTPFIRADSADPERSHFDIRELNYVWISDTWELKVGISKVFWGVTEFVHLVDIINQTDFVENIDGEDKLGQPMVHVSIPRNWGVLDFFMLPYFRERTFPGEKGRNRTQLIVDTDRSVFESSDEENHIDFALRYNHTLGDWDFGIYHFNGTGREPSFTLEFDPGGLVLVPKYWLIEQTGLDVQAVKGNLLLKLESLYRSGQGDSFYALVGGLEYSFYNVVSRGVDIGLIVEWAYDDRDEDVSVVFNNDLMTGVRLALNDVSGTEVLAGFITDLDNSDRVLTIESSRRLRDNIKIVVDAYVVLQSSEDSLIHAIRNDNNIRIELARYF